MARGVLQMKEFGRLGRWGNQILQYSFLKTYARQHDLEVQIPAWIGEDLYGFHDARPDKGRYRVVYEKAEHGIDDTVIPHLAQPLCNVNVEGWFQYHMSYYRPHKEYIQDLFRKPVPAVWNRVAQPLEELHRRGETLVGMHIRRGDFGAGVNYLTPVSWYQQLLEAKFSRWPHAVLFIATEDLSLVENFRQFNPLIIEDLGLDLRQEPMANFVYLKHDLLNSDPRRLDFFPEWYLLQQCDVLLLPNSTFGFTAAMTSRTCRQVFRSDPAIRGFAELADWWDVMPCQFVNQADYRHIPGLYLDRNPYWPRFGWLKRGMKKVRQVWRSVLGGSYS
ncbi:MAG: hypothetical protein ACLP9L_38455 [Thermoguttaceae bacterium]